MAPLFAAFSTWKTEKKSFLSFTYAVVHAGSLKNPILITVTITFFTYVLDCTHIRCLPILISATKSPHTLPVNFTISCGKKYRTQSNLTLLHNYLNHILKNNWSPSQPSFGMTRNAAPKGKFLSGERRVTSRKTAAQETNK